MGDQQRTITQPGLPRGFIGWIVAWLMPLPHGIIYSRIAKVLSPQQEDELAEVACGGGHFLTKYASHVRYVAGLDLSDVQVKMATRKLRSRITAGTAGIWKGDASQLPWEDNRFSVITSMGSFIGFPEPLQALKEMYRVLCSGGRAVVSIEFNAEDGKDHSNEVKKYGMWIWTEDEIRKMMEEAGFSEISITYDKGPGMPKMMLAQGIKL